MRKIAVPLITLVVGITIGLLLARKQVVVRGQNRTENNFAAVPGEVGGWDLTGLYDVVPDWPKPLSQLPGKGGSPWLASAVSSQ